MVDFSQILRYKDLWSSGIRSRFVPILVLRKVNSEQIVFGDVGFRGKSKLANLNRENAAYNRKQKCHMCQVAYDNFRYPFSLSNQPAPIPLRTSFTIVTTPLIHRLKDQGVIANKHLVPIFVLQTLSKLMALADIQKAQTREIVLYGGKLFMRLAAAS